jgi:hypothetical protein
MVSAEKYVTKKEFAKYERTMLNLVNKMQRHLDKLTIEKQKSRNKPKTKSRNKTN